MPVLKSDAPANARSSLPDAAPTAQAAAPTCRWGGLRQRIAPQRASPRTPAKKQATPWSRREGRLLRLRLLCWSLRPLPCSAQES
ncbi:MAG: hypothetical protein V7L04_11405 [Nostoc sp.]|uniref:hypothetical protein n=1 Tax=Nostoc sp. TaxID=1180 RepID=UPI002FFAC296